jgi:archaemetzincin
VQEVRLCWIGETAAEPALLEEVREHLSREYALPVRLMPGAALPAAAFDARRGQHDSGRILTWLAEHHDGGPNKILGVTDVDLFIPILTFVFGEAQLNGKAALVSIARLGGRPAFAAPRERLRARLLKEAAHELGHAFGLVHCGTPGCVMSRSPGVPEVDAKGLSLCADCRLLYRESAGQGV